MVGHSAKNRESGISGKLSKLSSDSIKVRFHFLADLSEKIVGKLGKIGSSREPIFINFSCREFSEVLFGQLFWRSANMCLRPCQTLPFVTHQAIGDCHQ
jgi:hypothetical protein